MLKQLLSRLERVHVATTREEREAVYRFRYEVYFEEFGRELGLPDHERRWVTDDDDEKDYTTILYTGSIDKITGTVRLRHWPAAVGPHRQVLVVAHQDYYASVGSLFAPMVRRFFGPGKRQPLDLAPYRRLFGPEERGLEFEPELVWSEVEVTLLSGRRGPRPLSFLDTLPREATRRLVSQGLVVDMPAGTLATRQGFRERELYVILEGRFAADDNGRHLVTMERGELFGECGFLCPDGRRTASVRALDASKVLILRGRSVEKLIRRDPDLGTVLRRQLADIMAHRQVAVA